MKNIHENFNKLIEQIKSMENGTSIYNWEKLLYSIQTDVIKWSEIVCNTMKDIYDYGNAVSNYHNELLIARRQCKNKTIQLGIHLQDMMNAAEKSLRETIYTAFLEMKDNAFQEVDHENNTLLHAIIKNENEATSFHEISLQTKVQALLEQALLNKDSNFINYQNNNKNTALHEAVIKQQINIIYILVNQTNINKNLQNSDGHTPYDLAMLWKESHESHIMSNPESMEQYTEMLNKLKPNDSASHTENVVKFSYSENMDWFMKLLEVGAKAAANAEEANAYIAIFAAIDQYYNDQSVEPILDTFKQYSGTDKIWTATLDGQTALHAVMWLAANFKNDHNQSDIRTIVEILLTKETLDINAKDKDNAVDKKMGGNTALHYAVFFADYHTFRLLLNHSRVDIHIKNNNNKTALDELIAVYRTIKDRTIKDCTIKDSSLILRTGDRVGEQEKLQNGADQMVFSKQKLINLENIWDRLSLFLDTSKLTDPEKTKINQLEILTQYNEFGRQIEDLQNRINTLINNRHTTRVKEEKGNYFASVKALSHPDLNLLSSKRF